MVGAAAAHCLPLYLQNLYHLSLDTDPHWPLARGQCSKIHKKYSQIRLHIRKQNNGLGINSYQGGMGPGRIVM